MRWFFSAMVIIFGVTTADFVFLKWTILGIGLFSIPVLMQFTSSKDLQIYGLWCGFFLILQTLISPVVINLDFKTLQPNMHEIVDVKSGIPGINGEQIITTDSKGFRTTRNIEYESSEPYRIFAVGGSTTEQVLNDDHATWTHLTQEQLADELKLDVEVINTGVSGLRAKHHLATLQNIIDMNPDLVVFLIGINDWNRHIIGTFSEEDSSTALKAYREKYLLRATLLGSFLRLIYHHVRSSVKADDGPNKREDHGEYYTHQLNSLGRVDVRQLKPEDVLDKYKEELLAISETCQQNNIKCLFITQPTGYQQRATEEYKKGFWMTPPNQTYTLDFESMIHIASLYNSFLIQFSKEHGHYSCDAAIELAPTFDVFTDDCHFNTNGSVIMSKVVGSCITDLFGQLHDPQLSILPNKSLETSHANTKAVHSRS